MVRFCVAIWIALVGVVCAPRLEAQRVKPTIVRELPHDPQAFTQGFELDGALFIESTGLYGESQVRRVQPESGTPVVVRHLDGVRLFWSGASIDA